MRNSINRPNQKQNNNNKTKPPTNRNPRPESLQNAWYRTEGNNAMSALALTARLKHDDHRAAGGAFTAPGHQGV